MIRSLRAPLRASIYPALVLAAAWIPARGETVLTLETRIAVGADDAEQTPTGSMRLTSSDLEMIEDDVAQTVGLRFAGLDIPAGAVIVDAWVRFTVDETGSPATDLTLRAEDSDDAPGFTTSSGDLSARVLTSASVAWSPPAWNTNGESGPDQTTPGIAALIQEVVARPGWAPGGAIVLVITGTGKRVAVAYEGSPSSSALLHVDYVLSIASTFEARIVVAEDDVEEASSGSMRMSSSDLELTDDGGYQTVGLRYRDVSIPQGVTITGAWVQFETDESTSTTTDLLLQGEDVDDSAPFASTTFNVSSRSRTAASVAWSPSPWNVVGEMGQPQRTPDLSPIIQEILDRSGWSSGHALTLIITGTGHRVATAFEGGASGAALLHVDYAGNLPPDSVIDLPATDVTIVEGATVSFAGSGTDPDDSLPLSFRWDFGGAAAPSTVEDPGAILFSIPGVYNISLTVTDALGAVDATPATRVVTVLPNAPPQSTIDQPAGAVTVYEGESVVFSGSGSDPDGHLPLTWRWTFGGGLPDLFVEDPGEITFPSAGVHTVTFTAIDALGLADPTPATVQVTVMTNQAPQSTIDQPAAPVTLYEGESVAFSGSGSDPDGHLPLSWRWSFGGGLPDLSVEDPGPVTFPSAGVHTVTFTAIDARGLADPTPASVQVTVLANQPPQSTIDQPSQDVSIEPGGSVVFSGSAMDPDGHVPLTYHWTFDGVTPDVDVEDPGPVLFPTTGNYTVTFTAIDARGLADPVPAIRKVRVNLKPTAALSLAPSTGNAPLGILADATASSDPDGPIASWHFDFGDGAQVGPQVSPTASHQYEAGEWTATVTVTDAIGDQSTASGSVLVAGDGGGINLVANPSFETNTSGWGEQGGAVLTRVPGGFAGGFALQCQGPASLSSFGVNDSPNWVSVVPQAGARYLVSAWVRSDTARGRAKLRIREYLNGELLKRTLSPEIVLSPGWTPLTVDHVTQLTGTTLDLNVLNDPAAPGEIFLVDNIRIVPVDLGTAHHTYYTAPWGSDGNPGTMAAPFRTIQFAVDRLAPGDRLLIRGGTYHESLTIARQGTMEHPIVIQGYGTEKVVIDAGILDFRSPGNSDWELFDPTRGEYRSVRSFPNGSMFVYVDGVPGYENGRVELVPYTDPAAFRSLSETWVDSSTPFYVGPGHWLDPADGRLHVRLSKTADMRAYEARHGTVIEGENADPRAYPILASQVSSTIHINGSWLTLRNLTVFHAAHSVDFAAGAHHVVLDGLTVWKGDSAISGASGGVHDITVTNSRIFGDSAQWVFWSDRKDPPAPAGRLTSSAIDLAGGDYNWEISFNHIRGGHDLIGLRTSETEIFVHHNRLENCDDDGLEIEGTIDIGHIEVFENYIGNCLTAVAPGQQSRWMTGPLYVYRNIVAALRPAAINRTPGINTWNGGGRYGYEYMFKHGTSFDHQSRNTHYYQNTLVMLDSSKGMNTTPHFPNGSTVANNLMVVVNGPVHTEFRFGKEQVIDGNLYWRINQAAAGMLVGGYLSVPAFRSATGVEQHGLGDVPGIGTDPMFLTPIVEIDSTANPLAWTITADSEFHLPSDFLLAASSPAINAGVPLRPGLPDTRVDPVPDIGAIPFGATMDKYRFFPFDPNAPPRPRGVWTLNP